MRVRHLITESKTEESDTRWRSSDLQPRYAPIYPRTRPIRAGWEWRSARAVGTDRRYVLLAQCNPNRGNWQSLLILEGSEGPSVVARFEDHGSHPGLHTHVDCERVGVDTGPNSLDDLARLPSAHNYHRRKRAWTREEFWTASQRFFRVATEQEPQGSLL